MQEPLRIEVPVPFRVRTANAWLFPGPEPALVDSGIGTAESYGRIVAAVRGAGVDPRRLRLFITHGHVDHAGGAAWLRRDFGVPLHAPREESPHVETFRRDSVARNDDFADALRRHGMPDADVRRLRGDSDQVDAFLEDVPIVSDVADGDRVALGATEALAVRTPGHTPGSVCFHVTEQNDLLTGDTLLETITSNSVELLDRDRGAYHRYVRSLHALRRFVGCRALPGHRTPFRVTDDLLDRHLAQHDARRATILAALDRPRTAHGLVPVVFPHLRRDDQLFMAMCELVGHLHALELDGAARGVDDPLGAGGAGGAGGAVRRFVAA